MRTHSPGADTTHRDLPLPGTPLPGGGVTPGEIRPIGAALRFAVDAPQITLFALLLWALASIAPETIVALFRTAIGAMPIVGHVPTPYVLAHSVLRYIGYSLTAAAVVTAVGYGVAGRRLGPTAAIKLGMRRFWPIFVLYAAPAAVAQLGIIAMTAGAAAIGVVTILVAALGFASCLLIPVLLYISVRLAFSVQAICLAGEGVVGGLKHSWRLSRGNFAFVLTYVLALIIPAVAALFVFYIVVVALSLTMSGAGGHVSGPEISILASIALALGGLAQLLVLTFLWYRIRGESEGLNLDAVLAELPR